MMDEVAPEFNSSLQYLWRISNMLWSAHTARMDDTTTRDEFAILEQLEIELDPRMSYVERAEAEYFNKLARKSLSPIAIKEYFRYLNRTAHLKGLIMKDKSVLPGVVENTR